MGLNDRDYMKWDHRDRKRKRDSKRGGSPLPPAMLVALKVLLTFLGIFICLRLALPGGLRLALAFGALLLGAYWIWRGLAGSQR